MCADDGGPGRATSQIKDWKRLLIKVKDVTLYTDGTAAFHRNCKKCMKEVLPLVIFSLFLCVLLSEISQAAAFFKQ